MNGITPLRKQMILPLPCEDTVRRWPSASQEESPHQNPTWSLCGFVIAAQADQDTSYASMLRFLKFFPSIFRGNNSGDVFRRLN
jgi:hypothetical protein